MIPALSLTRARDVVRERRLPWRLRWLKYLRPTRPLASLRVLKACWRDSADLPSILLHQFGGEFLRETADACRCAGVIPFLAFGTLLGHHRDHGFIAHDADIDFGLLERDFDKRERLKAEMERRGFVTRMHNDNEIAFYKPEFPTLFVDFFLFHRQGDRIVYRDARGTARYEFDFPSSVFDMLVPATLYGVDVRVPIGVEAFLTATYGDWRTRKKQFDNVNDHPNLKVVAS
jgi:hypothetical protein